MRMCSCHAAFARWPSARRQAAQRHFVCQRLASPLAHGLGSTSQRRFMVSCAGWQATMSRPEGITSGLTCAARKGSKRTWAPGVTHGPAACCAAQR
jgi:hypothetical protein